MKIATLQCLSQHPCIVAFFFLPQPPRTAVPTVAPLSAVCGRFRGGLGKVPHLHQKSRTTAPCRRSPGTAESRKRNQVCFQARDRVIDFQFWSFPNFWRAVTPGSKIKQDKGTAPAEPTQVTLSGNARHFYGGLPVVYRCFRIFGGCYDRGQETEGGARLGVTKPDSLRDTRVFPCANAGA